MTRLGVEYQILKLNPKGILVLWDGPNLSLRKARQILKTRREPGKFFLYRRDPELEKFWAPSKEKPKDL